MTEILTLAALFLVPVAALLFLTRRRLPAIDYPHFLLEPSLRRGLSGSLARFLRTWYDSILDAAIAICLALVLASSGFSLNPSGAWRQINTGRKAVVIDLSLSMLEGPFGKRPLDRALTLLSGTARFKDYKVFGLVFDPGRRKTILVPLEKYLTGGKSETSAVRIVSSFDFFSVDYSALKQLPAKGFSAVTFLTDSFPAEASGFELVELKKEEVDDALPAGHSWPASARHDRARAVWTVEMVDSGPSPALTVSVRKAGVFVPVAPAIVQIQSLPGGSRIILREPGLYRISVRNGVGSDQDFPVLFTAASHTVSASGQFSRVMAACFPLLEESISPELTLADSPVKAVRGRKTITSAILSSDCPYILDPATTAASPIAADFRPDVDFSLGKASITSQGLVLAYDSAILASFAPSYATKIPDGSTALAPVGSAWIASTPSGPIPLLPEPGEFFPDLPSGRLVLPPPSAQKNLWALLFFLLVVAKILVAKRLKPRASRTAQATGTSS